MTLWTEADLQAFLKVLDPENNSTGGGTASAVAGAMAAGLVGMVARVSIGKPDLESDEFYTAIDTQARDLTRLLMRGGTEDSEAFGAVMRSFTLPKCTDDEKSARSAAIGAAMIEATRVPLENAARCIRVLELADRVSKEFNENAASDLEVARSLARSAAEGCLENVQINLSSVKDEAIRAEIEDRTSELRNMFTVLAGGGNG